MYGNFSAEICFASVSVVQLLIPGGSDQSEFGEQLVLQLDCRIRSWTTAGELQYLDCGPTSPLPPVPYSSSNCLILNSTSVYPTSQMALVGNTKDALYCNNDHNRPECRCDIRRIPSGHSTIILQDDMHPYP